MTVCRWCLREIVSCTATPVPVCKGWKHVQFMDTMPIGAHYCGGRSIYPSAEPAPDLRATFSWQDNVKAPLVV